MLLRNFATVKGKLLKKIKIRDNLYSITIMTRDSNPMMKSYPRLTCRSAKVISALENINVGDFVSVEAHIGDRKIFNEGARAKTVGCLYVDDIKRQSLAEEFGFVVSDDSTSNREFVNELNLVGIVDNISRKGKVSYISIATPKKVVLVDYNPNHDYSNATRESILCLKAVVRAGRKDFGENADEKVSNEAVDTVTAADDAASSEAQSTDENNTKNLKSKYVESYVVSQAEIVSTDGFLRK